MKNVITGSWAGGYQDVSLLVLRVVTGLVFLAHGWTKLMGPMSPEGFAGMLGTLGVPLPLFFSWIVIIVEVVGGVALILGAWTRLWAQLGAIVALVAVLLVHMSKGFFVSAGGYEFALLLFAASFVLLVLGSGKYGIDGWMGRSSI